MKRDEKELSEIEKYLENEELHSYRWGQNTVIYNKTRDQFQIIPEIYGTASRIISYDEAKGMHIENKRLKQKLMQTMHMEGKNGKKHIAGDSIFKEIYEIYNNEILENERAKPDEKRVEIIVTLKALIEIPERWIITDPNGEIKLKYEHEDDSFFIGLKRDDVCLTCERDFGLIDYLDTDEPEMQLAKDK